MQLNSMQFLNSSLGVTGSTGKRRWFPEPHSAALVSRAGLLLADFLVGVWGVEPPSPLLLLPLSKRVLPQSRVDPVVIELVESRGGRGHLHLPPRPRALQQHGEAVGVACTIALKKKRKEEGRFKSERLAAPSRRSALQHFCPILSSTQTSG